MVGSSTTNRHPLKTHLQELRRRVLWSVAAFIAASGLAYVFHEAVVQFLVAPLHQSLYYSKPQGGFEFLIRTSAMAGLVVVIPLIAYQLIKFTEPALAFRFNRRYMLSLMSASLVLLVLGVAFGYVIILPLTLHFFAGFGNPTIKALISADSYLSLVLGLLATFAVLFQLPLLVLLINRITPLTPRKMMRYQRHVIIASLVISLVLPFTYDPLTQFVMAVPIILLYELSIILVWLTNRKKTKATSKSNHDETKAVIPPVPAKPKAAIAHNAPRATPPLAAYTTSGVPRNSRVGSRNVLDLRPKA